MKEQDIKQVVQELYGKIARGEVKSCCPSGCDATGAGLSLAVGYSLEDLQLAPEAAVLGLGCGNPTALADLKEGETVLDLGSGAGIDAFLAAKKVGYQGRVIGVDITADMVAQGRRLAAQHGFANVDFRLGDIEHLPVESASVDVVISNCVINLTPDKLVSFKEIYRVLKPGGRILIADLVTAGELPPEVRASAAAWTECIAGAMEKEAYLETIRRAGFSEVTVVAEFVYEVPGMDERLRDKILSVKVRGVNS